MPQLNPAPWFMILVFTWLIFLTIVPHKVLGHNLPNQALAPQTQAAQKMTWTWTWH